MTHKMQAFQVNLRGRESQAGRACQLSISHLSISEGKALYQLVSVTKARHQGSRSTDRTRLLFS